MRKTLAVIPVLYSLALFAQEPVSPSMLLEAKLEALGTFAASFEQTTHEQDGFLLDEQSGKLSFSRPSLLHWEAEMPFAQTLVADGIDIYLFDPDLNQVTVRPWSSNPAENPAAIFLGDQALSSHFMIEMEGDLFLLKPISETSSVLQIRLGFDADAPQLLEIRDSLGQTTKIDFSEQVVNPILAPDMFEFSIPEGAEVVTDG